MRIQFDISADVHRHAGLGRYAHELLTALLKVDSKNEYRTFFSRPSAGEHVTTPLDRLPAYGVPFSAKPWRMSVLLAQLAHVPMDSWLPASDVFHATDHLLPRLRKTTTVFTVHDLIFLHYPEYHLPLNRWYLNLMMPRFLRSADALIAVSENTKRDVVRLMQIPPEKVTVIYEGVGAEYEPQSDFSFREYVLAKYGLPSEYILFFATLEPRKNILTLLDAYQALLARGKDVPALVVAGRKGWLYQPVFDRVRELGIEDRVFFTGWVDEQDTPTIMSAALVFVYPSLYEGFGLPPLEAMACGTPVVCSNASSLPEVVGDAGLLFEPRDTKALADLLSRVVADADLRSQLRARGIDQARKFSWERAAQETLAVYQSVAKKHSPR